MKAVFGLALAASAAYAATDVLNTTECRVWIPDFPMKTCKPPHHDYVINLEDVTDCGTEDRPCPTDGGECGACYKITYNRPSFQDSAVCVGGNRGNICQGYVGEVFVKNRTVSANKDHFGVSQAAWKKLCPYICKGTSECVERASECVYGSDPPKQVINYQGKLLEYPNSCDAGVKEMVVEKVLCKDQVGVSPIEDPTLVIQPIDNGASIQPIDNGASIQPIHDPTLVIQPIDNGASIQPIHDPTFVIQPIDTGASIQPIDNGASIQPIHDPTLVIQPIDNGASIQPIDNGASIQPIHDPTLVIQPIDNGASIQPIHDPTLVIQPIDNGASIQPIDNGASIQPIDVPVTEPVLKEFSMQCNVMYNGSRYTCSKDEDYVATKEFVDGCGGSKSRPCFASGPQEECGNCYKLTFSSPGDKGGPGMDCKEGGCDPLFTHAYIKVVDSSARANVDFGVAQGAIEHLCPHLCTGTGSHCVHDPEQCLAPIPSLDAGEYRFPSGCNKQHYVVKKELVECEFETQPVKYEPKA